MSSLKNPFMWVMTSLAYLIHKKHKFGCQLTARVSEDVNTFSADGIRCVYYLHPAHFLIHQLCFLLVRYHFPTDTLIRVGGSS